MESVSLSSETKFILEQAREEIKSLRIRNREMGLRLKMFDDCMNLLNTRNRENGMCMGEDVAWKIDKLLAVDKVNEPGNANGCSES